MSYPKRQTLDVLQALRGVAATLVVGYHLMYAVNEEGFTWWLGDTLFSNGRIGVDIFFVLSGFIIFYSCFKSAPPTISKFLVGRFFRIFPTYWAALVFMTLLTIGLVFVNGDASKIPSIATFLKSVLLLPMPLDGYLLIVAWTLTLELLFYAVFSFTALRYGQGHFFAAMILWYVASAFLVTDDPYRSTSLAAIFNPVVLEFMLGALVAYCVLKGRTRYHGLAFSVGCALIGTLIVTDHSNLKIAREWLYSPAAAILIYGGAGLRYALPRWVTLWGDSSYMLYLLHIPLLNLVGRGLKEAIDFNMYGSPLGCACLILFCIFISAFLTQRFEIRFQKWYKSRVIT